MIENEEEAYPNRRDLHIEAFYEGQIKQVMMDDIQRYYIDEFFTEEEIFEDGSYDEIILVSDYQIIQDKVFKEEYERVARKLGFGVTSHEQAIQVQLLNRIEQRLKIKDVK